MSANAPSLYAREFATNCELLLQQKGSRLRGKAEEKTHKGEQASPVDQIGKIEMQPVTTRFAPIGRVDAPVDRRWVYPSDFDLNQIMDSFDDLRLLSDPKSKYVQNAVFAAGRQMDRLLIAAMNGTAKTGKDGSTSVALPSAQKVAINFGAASNASLTVAKLREARKILMAADVDLDAEQLYVAVSAKEQDSLLAEAQVISTDFNARPVLVDGKITQFLGFNFVHTELLETSGGTTRFVNAWVKSGLHLGVWGDVMTDVDRRKDLSGMPWQAYIKMTMGATRLEEQKFVQIACTF